MRVAEIKAFFILDFYFQIGKYKFVPLSKITVFTDDRNSVSYCFFTVLKDNA